MFDRIRFGSKGLTEVAWLVAHPIAGAVVITVLTGLGLQLTHLIDFEERMSAVWELTRLCLQWGSTGRDAPRLQRAVVRAQRSSS